MTVALLDACVRYAAPLRDLLLHLTVQFVFQPKWTERIHAEWLENVLRNRPDIPRAALERTRDLMNQWARDWQPPDHDELIPTLSLPDPDDRHVRRRRLPLGRRSTWRTSRSRRWRPTASRRSIPTPSRAASETKRRQPSCGPCGRIEPR